MGQVLKEIRQAIQGTWLRNWWTHTNSFKVFSCTAHLIVVPRHLLVPAWQSGLVYFALFLLYYGFSLNYILGHACWLTQILSSHIYDCKREINIIYCLSRVCQRWKLARGAARTYLTSYIPVFKMKSTIRSLCRIWMNSNKHRYSSHSSISHSSMSGQPGSLTAS